MPIMPTMPDNTGGAGIGSFNFIKINPKTIPAINASKTVLKSVFCSSMIMLLKFMLLLYRFSCIMTSMGLKLDFDSTFHN